MKGQNLLCSTQFEFWKVIYEEHKRHESMWLEEQKCANRLLLASAAQGAIPAVGDERQVLGEAFELWGRHFKGSELSFVGDKGKCTCRW